VEQYPTGFLKLDWELIMVLKTDLLLHQIQFLKTDYLGFAAKSFSWGQGVGCRVWGVGFYRFSGGQLPNFQGKSA
jgi:hypothetical protein